ncbi:OmpH family outer membrane protein [Flavobacterium sp.]|uniref:OmpH family outer membrane protein n=1 Tax=Flavobacterium sp. TaxID=239 RepID=UPI002627BD97|nr:OmpH family outer membrane protein [Flavobacterium sp.]
MRKHIIALLMMIAVSTAVHAQSRGVKIGYIDMEYILQNVPDYNEAKNQLEQKAQKWKQEIETKKNEVSRLKDLLATERVLLTKELLEEREEEIAFQEKELLDYQEKRFGPKGDLTIQKAVLAQPVQDQVFNAAQDIAEAKKYDFIFDKTSDLTILFAAKRYDISDQVVRVITRSNKRKEGISKKEQKEEAKKEALENMEDESPALAERNKKLAERKAARDKLIADKKLVAEERKQQMLAAKEAKKNGTPIPAKAESKKTSKDTVSSKTDDIKLDEKPAKKEADSTAVVKKQKSAEDRAKILADRKKALEDKKKKILEDREAAKKAKEDKLKEGKQD